MEEARAVIARLDRIEAMERAQEPAELVLSELALLMLETKRWLEREKRPAPAARERFERCLSRWRVSTVLQGVPRRSGDATISGEEHSLV